jgi:hypothetical protein
MIRDSEKRKQSLQFHEAEQLRLFTTRVNQVKAAAKKHRVDGNLEKWDKLLTQAEKMKFQFDSSGVSSHFGNCSKFDKPVSFIPNVCQLETQTCFENRNSAN